MRFLFLITFIFISCHGFSQKSADEQLAEQFLSNKEYDKAVIYYEKLYDKNPLQYYSLYYKTLLALHDLKHAEKIVKKQLKTNPAELSYYVDLGLVYEADSNIGKAKEQYEKAIKEESQDIGQELQLGKAFLSARKFDYAIEAYKKGRRYNAAVYPFFYELADVYKARGDVRSMINEYLDALDFKETELSNVQMQLQNGLGYDDEKGGFNNPILRQELQRRIQSHPDKSIYSDFLIYILIQQKDFEAAFIHTKAMDKRKKEEGSRLMDLGRICLLNEDYETAQQCFDYVLELGKNNYNYPQACVESCNAQYEKIIREKNYTPQELVELEQKLQSTVKQFGYNQLSLPLIHKLAVLQGFYLNKPQEAITLLQEVLAAGLDKNITAELKLDLGDLELISGDVWEASLSYSQVEKAFKYEVIGQEAKFRNAKIAFYTGDFKWAKAQLDVLKGATSKLIANDAMELSQVITDAIGIDTNTVPLEMFASAELLLLQHKTTEGLQRMDSINILFDNHSLADDIYFKKGQVFASMGRYTEALEAYKRVTDAYSEDIYADDALFKTAEIYQYNLKDIEKAKASYQDVLTKYPGSVYTVEARKRYRKLRGDVVN